MCALEFNFIFISKSIDRSFQTRQVIKELPIKLISAFFDGMHVWGYNGAEKSSTNITVWEARTGKVLQQMTRHKDAVHSFTLLNRNVWASSGDSSITVWQLRASAVPSAPVAGAAGVALPLAAAAQTAPVSVPAPRWTKPQLPGRSVCTTDRVVRSVLSIFLSRLSTY